MIIDVNDVRPNINFEVIVNGENIAHNVSEINVDKSVLTKFKFSEKDSAIIYEYVQCEFELKMIHNNIIIEDLDEIIKIVIMNRLVGYDEVIY